MATQRARVSKLPTSASRQGCRESSTRACPAAPARSRPRLERSISPRWWNTNGQLGPLGSTVVRRGFRHTHYFAQARSVFAVAAHRCREVYDLPGTVTLWNLPAEMEDEVEATLGGVAGGHRCGHLGRLLPASRCMYHESGNRAATCRGFVTGEDIERIRKLRRGAEQRAVPVPGEFSSSTADLTTLALALARGEIGNLAVPYQSSGEAQ